MSQPAPARDTSPPSTGAGGAGGPMDLLWAAVKQVPRLENDRVTRPHPLLVMVAREEYAVVLAPAAVWDRGRELLKPFVPRFADATALLILVGRPTAEGALAQAMNRGLGSI